MIIKNVRDKLISFFLFFNFISAIYIPCLGYYIENISIYYFVINVITTFLIIILNRKIRIRKYLLYVIGYYTILLIPTILYKGSVYSLLFEFGVASLSFLVWCSFEEKQIIKYLKVPTFVFEILTLINFLIVVFLPNGLYHVSTIRNYYLFDHVNVSIRYLLPGTCLVMLTDYLSKNKITIKSKIYIVVVSLTLILTKPITGIIGYIVFLFALILLNTNNARKLISPFKYFAGSGIISSLIIVVNIQKYFQKFIVNVLHKEVTLSGRIDIWNKAIYYIRNRGLFGNGRIDSISRTLLFGASSAHNQFLNYLFEGGLVMLIYIFFCIFKISNKLVKCKNLKIVKVFTAVMISYAVMWITEPFSYSGTFALFFIWMLMYYSRELFDNKELNT